MKNRFAVCRLCDHAHSSREGHKLIGGPEPSKAVRDLAAVAVAEPVTVATGPITEREAVDLTNRIRQTRDDWLRLVYEAYEREAWRAMGYESWTAYVAAELPVSRSRSYQLLAHARITLALGSGELSTMVDSPPERQTRNVSGAARERITKATTVDPEAGRNQLQREVERVAECEHPRRVITCADCGKHLP